MGRVVNIIQDEATSTLFYSDGNNFEDLRFPAQGINPPGAVSDPTRDTNDATFFV